jgi:hypothetical protein
VGIPLADVAEGVMSTATRQAITKLIGNKTPREAIEALDIYVQTILVNLALGKVSVGKAHRDLDEAYGYRAVFISRETGEVAA